MSDCSCPGRAEGKHNFICEAAMRSAGLTEQQIADITTANCENRNKEG